MTDIATRFKIRRDTAAKWTSLNPVLLEAEPALETDTLKVKYGDGVTAWTSLSYAAAYTDEMARDALGTALTAGAGITITPNDGADTITVASTITQYTDEMARDALGAALTAGAGITITPNDGADTITIAATGVGGNVLHQRYTANGTVGTYTFSAIPSGYSALKLMVYGRGSVAAVSAYVRLRFNADSGANYDTRIIYTNSAATASAYEYVAITYAEAGGIAGSTAPASVAGLVIGEIPRYADTTFHKTGVTANTWKTTSASNGGEYQSTGIFWRNTAAITTIEAFLDSGNYVSGSVLELWLVP